MIIAKFSPSSHMWYSTEYCLVLDLYEVHLLNECTLVHVEFDTQSIGYDRSLDAEF